MHKKNEDERGKHTSIMGKQDNHTPKSSKGKIRQKCNEFKEG